MKTALKVVLALAVIGWLSGAAGNVCRAQSAPANLSPDIQEVLKLSQQKMTDDVITSYVRNSGKIYKLDADDIIYLTSQGVSKDVINTMLQTESAASPSPAAAPTSTPTIPVPSTPAPPVDASGPGPLPPPAPAPPMPDNGPPPPDGGPAAGPDTAPPPPSADVNFGYFQNQLAPFGTWVQVPGYGPCWHPDAALAANPDWRPYYDMGRWVYTDNGWFWQSDYTWGDIPFHYGNWIQDPTFGWLWVPGYTWGPSWVFWRQAESDGYIGWAPLPPGAVFVDGGWFYHGAHYGVDFDFGLGAGFFVFVGNDHFHDGFFRMRGREYPYHVSRDRARGFYGRSVLRNDFRRDEHGRLVNDGIGRDRVERLTNHRETVSHFEERNPVGDRNAVHGGGDAHDSHSGATGGNHSTSSASKVYRPPSSGSSRSGGGGGSQKRQ